MRALRSAQEATLNPKFNILCQLMAQAKREREAELERDLKRELRVRASTRPCFSSFFSSFPPGTFFSSALAVEPLQLLAPCISCLTHSPLSRQLKPGAGGGGKEGICMACRARCARCQEQGRPSLAVPPTPRLWAPPWSSGAGRRRGAAARPASPWWVLAEKNSALLAG